MKNKCKLFQEIDITELEYWLEALIWTRMLTGDKIQSWSIISIVFGVKNYVILRHTVVSIEPTFWNFKNDLKSESFIETILNISCKK